jgi:hypothetical protein
MFPFLADMIILFFFAPFVLLPDTSNVSNSDSIIPPGNNFVHPLPSFIPIYPPCNNSNGCVIPVAFTSAEKKNMLLNIRELIDSNVIAIDLDRHQRLILALRTASATDMILNKDTTESHDLLDALSLACKQITINR